jgi:hypothetical protein
VSGNLGPPTAGAESLASLLAPYVDPDPEQAGRLRDVPARVARAALEHLPADLRDARLNGTQPPMSWLAAQAADLGGRLVGSLVPGRAFVRFDAVQVERQAVDELVRRVASEIPGALEAAIAEAWASWKDEQPMWTGSGTDLLDGRLPPGAAVVGLWWD